MQQPVNRLGRGPRLLLTLLLLLVAASLAPPGQGQERAADGQAAGSALLLTWEGPIGPASADYLLRGLQEAARDGHGLVILRLDTPGGLDSSMRQMIQGILASPVPVATWVWPRGARAASAGTYILYASHVAAMAPGTTLGAATPVRVGAAVARQSDLPPGQSSEDEQEEASAPRDPMSAKMVEDAVAYIRSLAELHGRNADWAEKAVREAASLPAAEAEREGVIDLIASDLEELLTRLDGRRVVMDRNQEATLATAGMTLVEHAPDWRARLLAIISNPNLALVLMMIGIYGLIFEFSNPGALYPGTLGAISLLLALFSFSILPLDYAGLALLLLGVALMVAEALVPSVGILGVGGAIAFALGAAMLFDEVEAPGFQVSWWTIGIMTGLSVLLLAVVLRLVTRSLRHPVRGGREELIGSSGTVVEWEAGSGRVRVQGEIWRARSAHPLAPGARVKVTNLEGLLLEVSPQDQARNKEEE